MLLEDIAMAVTQISQIQIRYGLQEDIGALAAGELAWAIDTQRLFIGNGNIDEGAPVAGLSELLTTNSIMGDVLGTYTYKGVLGGYEVVTGINSSTPVIRSLQDKIDDFVNVRDYSVNSTGSSDETASLQRAINETYNRQSVTTAQRTRRALRFNAGTYRIDGEIKIPPYATFIGEGIDSVKIILNGPGARLVTTTGANASEDINIGEYPKSIQFKGLTIQRSTDDDILTVDGSTDIIFEDVAFAGPRVRPNTIGTGSCVTIKSTVRDTSDIHFNRCRFSGLGYAALFESTLNIKNVSFISCNFKDLWNGLRMSDLGGTVTNVRITGCFFKDLYSTAIYGSQGATGIISNGNTYINCASGYEGDISPVGTWQPIILFQSNGNYSFMDIFARTPANSKIYPRLSSGTYKVAYMSLDEYFGLGTANYYPGVRVEIEDGAVFNLPTVSIKHGYINYSIERGTMTRNGVINFSTNNGLVSWSDDYVETNDLGVLFNISVTDDIVILNGVTDSNGYETTLSFDIKNLA